MVDTKDCSTTIKNTKGDLTILQPFCEKDSQGKRPLKKKGLQHTACLPHISFILGKCPQDSQRAIEDIYSDIRCKIFGGQKSNRRSICIKLISSFS
jgi:hypothetical protein